MDSSTAKNLRDFAAEFDRRFAEYLPSADDGPAELVEAMRYSALAPGKRIRPCLVVTCCDVVGGNRSNAWPAAAAVECVHAFSLVHDDLPAMDDDDLRRGQPTTHKKFGEAVAILAGDALAILAFELIAGHVEDPRVSGQMALELARAAGVAGMTGGQAADIAGETEAPSLERTLYIHEHKTASLFVAACRLGAFAGAADDDAIEALGRFGLHLGRAFQIADDLLDVTASVEKLGKAVRKDVSAGKQTYPGCVGTERSRRAADEAIAAAVGELARFDTAAEDLRSLAHYAAARNY